MCTERYISPFTDFGFKRLFGSEASKEFMIDLLNSLLQPPSPIVELTYLTQERLGMSEGMRNAIFDIYCRADDGTHIIVEMQNMPQKFFVDRSIFYSTFPIQEAAKKGRWDFNLPDVYTVCFLDFRLDAFRDDPDWTHTIRLCDTKTGREFSRKLTYIYMELPKYQKTVGELEGRRDEWAYLIKHLNSFEDVPEQFQEGLFGRFVRHAQLSVMDERERRAYEESLRELRDYTNTIATAEERGEAKGLKKGRKEGRKEGLKEGLQKGRKEGLEEGLKEGEARGGQKRAVAIAQRLLALGLPVQEVAASTGLSVAEVEALL